MVRCVCSSIGKLLQYHCIMNQFYEGTKTLENFLLEWARPDGWKESPLANYPLANFDAAVTVAIGYLCFVVFGSVSAVICST